MKNRFFLHKFLPVLIVFIMFLILLCTSCFAKSDLELTTVKGYTATLLDLDILSYSNVLFINTYNNANATGYMFLSNGGYFAISFMSGDENGFKLNCFDADGNPVPFLYYTGINCWSKSNFTTSINGLDISKFSEKSASTSSFIVKAYSNIGWSSDVITHADYSVFSLNSDGSLGNDLVFQGAPQVTPEEPEEVAPVELAPLMTSINFLEVMAEVLAILPILLVVVIGLLALRKAIKLLLQTLQKA